VSGVREAAWPLVRTDLRLGYLEVGLVLSVPAVASAVIEPAFGVLVDAGWRRPLMVVGAAAFAASLALMAAAWSFPPLLAATVGWFLASGALVGTAQTALMDLRDRAREQAMARWTLAGSVGAVLGPLVLAGSIALGGGWRPPLLALALAGLLAVRGAAMLPASRPQPTPPPAPPTPPAGAAETAPGDPACEAPEGEPAPARARPGLRDSLRPLLAALRDLDVLRSLALLQLTELGGDVFGGFLALYMADVADAGAIGATLAVATWTGAGLGGDALLVVLLSRVPGGRLLRASAVAAAVLLPAFLLAPGLAPRLVFLAGLSVAHAAWYPVLQGRLYDSLPGASGAALALSSLASGLGAALPLALGAVAATAGLDRALWLALLAPLALLTLLPAGRGSSALTTRLEDPEPPA
jgi:MFS transporter, FSR family, fosmidomycin resistance protein